MPSRILPIESAPRIAMSLVGTQRVLIRGDDRAHNLGLELVARSACEGQRVLFICGDNRFDPYHIARKARAADLDDDEVLSSILIARAFTAYQLHELVLRLDTAPSGHLIIISNPCAAFFDDDVPIKEAARFFYRMLWKIIDIAGSGRGLLLTQPTVVPNTRRAYFLSDLSRCAEIVLHLQQANTFVLERNFRSNLRFLGDGDGPNRTTV